MAMKMLANLSHKSVKRPKQEISQAPEGPRDNWLVTGMQANDACSNTFAVASIYQTNMTAIILSVNTSDRIDKMVKAWVNNIDICSGKVRSVLFFCQ